MNGPIVLLVNIPNKCIRHDIFKEFSTIQILLKIIKVLIIQVSNDYYVLKQLLFILQIHSIKLQLNLL